MDRPVKLLSWNVHGMVSSTKRRQVNEVLWRSSADIYCLQEHRLGAFEVGLLKFVHPTMDCFPAINRRGAGGSIILVNKHWCAKLAFAHPEGMVVAVQIQRQEYSWLVISVYAPNVPAERRKLWSWIQSRIMERDTILCGDLNRGDVEGSPEWASLATELDLVDAVQLSGENGDKGDTWARISQKGKMHSSRLDKVYISNQGYWLPPPFEFRLDRSPVCSDHIPLTFSWSLLRKNGDRKSSPYKLNVQHLEVISYGAMVRREWGSHLAEVVNAQEFFDGALKRVVNASRSFGKRRKRELEVKYDEHCIELVGLRLQPKDNQTLENTLRMRELENAIQQYQRSKINAARIQSGIKWVQYGDAPSSFFFNKIKAKRVKENINGIRNDQGEWITNSAEINSAFVSSLQMVCGQEEVSSSEKSRARCELLGHVSKFVTKEDARNCELEFSEGELLAALQALPNRKAPGIDGIPREFYDKYWDVVKGDVTRMINHSWKRGTLSPLVNDGLITLIPKNAAREKPQDWRPITLLNTSYKIFAKALALRLKYLLPRLVGGEQFGFVHGRSIFENILNVAGAIDYACDTGMSAMMLNVDMDKAYDRVEWSYIVAVLEKMGFGFNFRRMVSSLFSNASASVLVNGVVVGSFSVKRSIRQGCPLAPLLYAVITEPFIACMVSGAAAGRIGALQIPNSNKKLVIQMFADDSTSFCQGRKEDLEQTLQVYEKHCAASGSLMNGKKTVALWLGNGPRPDWTVDYVFRWVNVGEVVRHLGFPLGLGISTSDRAKWVLDKVGKKFSVWKGKPLTWGGRLTVAKAMLAPTISYPIAMCLFSKVAFERFDKMLRSFLWAESGGARRFHTTSWKVVTAHRFEGGLGLLNMRRHSLALLAKLIPKVFLSDAPWVGFLRHFVSQAKCGRSILWGELELEDKLLSPIPLKIRNSSLFNGLVTAWKEVGKELKWTGKPLGEGDSSLKQSIWWSPGYKDGRTLGTRYDAMAVFLGKRGLLSWGQLWDSVQGQWWSAEVIRQRLRLPVSWLDKIHVLLKNAPTGWPTNPTVAPRDPLVEWSWGNGIQLQHTTAKAAYESLNHRVAWHDKLNLRWHRNESHSVWSARCNRIWRGSPFPHYNLWNWRVLTGSLATGVKLRSWELASGLCPWCRVAKETSLHLFWACPCLRRFWKEVKDRLCQVFGFCRITAHMVLIGIDKGHSSEFQLVWQVCRAVLTEEIWRARNDLIFNSNKSEISANFARSCLAKVGWILKQWRGKTGDLPKQIATRLTKDTQALGAGS